jgi:hypothetical protein
LNGSRPINDGRRVVRGKVERSKGIGEGLGGDDEENEIVSNGSMEESPEGLHRG